MPSLTGRVSNMYTVIGGFIDYVPSTGKSSNSSSSSSCAAGFWGFSLASPFLASVGAFEVFAEFEALADMVVDAGFVGLWCRRGRKRGRECEKRSGYCRYVQRCVALCSVQLVDNDNEWMDGWWWAHVADGGGGRCEALLGRPFPFSDPPPPFHLGRLEGDWRLHMWASPAKLR